MGIVLEGVSKRFGNFVAVDDVSLSVRQGSLTALLGPSGSGKSTMLRIGAGLEAPDSGTVLLDGNDCTNVPARRRDIGLVFQHYAAFKHMRVRDNVAFAMKIRREPKSRVRARADELLELVGLAGLGDRYPSQLSGGQRQRMCLARALAAQPKVLLLDEPFGALDAAIRKELRRWLRRLHEEVEVTTLLVTHDQEEAMDVAEQVAVMNRGRIEQVGSPSDIYERPASEFVMDFVGPVTRLGNAAVRPHDLDILLDAAPGAVQAMVERVVPLGFEVRVELRGADGESLWAQLTRHQREELELSAGQIVYVRSTRSLPAASLRAESQPRVPSAAAG